VRQRLYDKLTELAAARGPSVLPPPKAAAGKAAAAMPKPMVGVESLPPGVAHIPAGEAEGHLGRLALAGFCPVTLVRGQGLLARADATVGLLQLASGQVFGFANTDAAAVFGRQSADVLADLRGVLQRFPTLIHLLGMRDAFPNFAGERRGRAAAAPAAAPLAVAAAARAPPGAAACGPASAR